MGFNRSSFRVSQDGKGESLKEFPKYVNSYFDNKYRSYFF